MIECFLNWIRTWLLKIHNKSKFWKPAKFSHSRDPMRDNLNYKNKHIDDGYGREVILFVY